MIIILGLLWLFWIGFLLYQLSTYHSLVSEDKAEKAHGPDDPPTSYAEAFERLNQVIMDLGQEIHRVLEPVMTQLTDRILQITRDLSCSQQNTKPPQK